MWIWILSLGHSASVMRTEQRATEHQKKAQLMVLLQSQQKPVDGYYINADSIQSSDTSKPLGVQSIE